MNFNALKQQIETASKKAFTEMYDKHGTEEIYAFALYSDEGAMTVCPSTNTVRYLDSVDDDEFDYYKFEPAEWKYEMQGADDEFNEISKQLRMALEKDKTDDEEVFLKFQSQLFTSCIEVLEKLKNEGFFKNIIGRDIFLIFTVSDYDFEPKDIENIVTRLNDSDYKNDYLAWMRTW